MFKMIHYIEEGIKAYKQSMKKRTEIFEKQ